MKRRYDYDILRIFSMLGVIYLHTATDALRTPDLVPLWNFSNILAAFATPAVPLFFMMSGALLLRDERTSDLRGLLCHRLPKVFFPLCIWSAITLLYYALSGGPEQALDALAHILNTPASFPYWFLYAMIPMYLLSPLLKKMCSGLTRAHWHYMMGLWVICTLGLFTLRSFVPDAWQPVFTEHWTLNVNVVGGYLGYFLLGAYLEQLERTPSKKALAAIIAAMIAVSIIGTRWDTYAHNAYSDRFTNYLSLFTLLLSTAIFLLFKSCLRTRTAKGKLPGLLSNLSFCVYLMHPLVVGAGKLVFTHLTGHSAPITIIQQLVLYLGIVVICLLSALILASLKPLCYLFTGQRWIDACKSSNLFALLSPKNKTPDT